MESHPVFVLVGVGAGIVAGLFGVGGGIIIVPVLGMFGVSAVQAVGTSVLIVLVNGLSGAVQHGRQGTVALKRAVGLAVGAALMAPLGSLLADWLPDRVLRGLFFVLLIAVGFAMVRDRGDREPKDGVVLWWAGPLVGALGGFLAGLFGIGGGVVMVPLQVLLLGAGMLSAVGTSLAVMVVSAAAALATHAWCGNVLWLTGAWLAVGGVVGAPVGSRLAQRLGDTRLRLAFVAALSLLALAMLAQTLRPS